MVKKFSVSTPRKTALIDITEEVQKIVRDSSVGSGSCTVFVPHTTAAVTINENADPSVRSDIIKSLDKVVPENWAYSHAEGNSPAHVKASMMGQNEVILVENAALVLGTWQGIYFCEFDGPRKRSVMVRVSKD